MSDLESDSLDAALSNLPQLIRKRVQKLEEREEAFMRMKEAFEAENPNAGNPSDVLRLNVGGTRIEVSTANTHVRRRIDAVVKI